MLKRFSGSKPEPQDLLQVQIRRGSIFQLTVMWNMQTFLPYPSFEDSAKALDDKRLRNQRNEAKVILSTLLGLYPPTSRGYAGGWPNHPATKMWIGHEEALCRYGIAICAEALYRGWVNGDLTIFFESYLAKLPKTGDPVWVGCEKFHASHRSNLLRKDPTYQQKWPHEPNNLPYVWPTKNVMPG